MKQPTQAARGPVLIDGTNWRISLKHQFYRKEQSEYTFEANFKGDNAVYLTVAFAGSGDSEPERFKLALDQLKQFVAHMLDDIKKIGP